MAEVFDDALNRFLRDAYGEQEEDERDLFDRADDAYERIKERMLNEKQADE